MRGFRRSGQDAQFPTTPPPKRTRGQRICRVLVALLFGLLVLIIGSLLLRFFLVPLLAYCSPQLDVWFYDLGVYGINPEQRYRSFNLTSEITRTPRWNEAVCDLEKREGGLVLIDVHGAGVTDKGPRIIDLQGNLVWTDVSYGQHAMNLQLQEWRGKQYLTFWAGDGDLGKYYMLDQGFNLVKTVEAIGENVWGDPHEFLITPDDTALITIYNCTHDIDLSSTYMTDIVPSILDAVIQEIHLETGELVWEWRASDHFGEGEYLKYSYDTSPAHLSSRPMCLYGEDQIEPRDYFHMNSIQKDSNGNYLVSIRRTHQVVTVDKDTKKILWGLGGRATDFDVVGEWPNAGDFKWQHDARWIDEDAGVLSLFDNGIAENKYDGNPYSTGRIIQLDIANRTATQLHSYHSLAHIRSTSQGAFQHLPGTAGAQDRANAGIAASERDQVFTGWGSAAAFSLHDAATEELLCETHYSPSLFFYWERTKTYRATRAPRHLRFRPERWDPSAVVDGKRVYVSWNGGMEVRSWKLRGSSDGDDWRDIATVAREGFETSFDLPKDDGFSTYCIAALDENGNVLRYSNTFEPSTGGIPMWEVLLVGSAAVVFVSVLFAYVREKKSGPRSPRLFATVFSTIGAGGNKVEGYRKLEASDEELDELQSRSPG